MNNKKANLFLDLYKQLEEELETKYRVGRRRFSSVIIEFIKDTESEPVRDALEACREIRNVLTHTANIGGQPVVEPSAPVVETMEKILAYVRRPPLALDYATRGQAVLTATHSQKAMRVMEVMAKNGFSHVPVMKNGSFCGVFSIGTVFQYVLKNGKNIGKDTTLGDMESHLPLREHAENYVFVPKDATYLYVRKQFLKIPEKNKRISVVFITETGKEEERLLGMLTPWDVLHEA